MAPVIRSCPEDVYVFENERVLLPKPTFYDNVGIYKENKNEIYDMDYFKKGLYFAVYCVKDYEGNTATCKVKVEASKSGNYVLIKNDCTSNFKSFICI